MVEYRSPFDVRLDTAAPSWVYAWSRYREDFATAESWDQKAYDLMLHCVSMDNPPNAPVTWNVRRTNLKWGLVTALACAAIVVLSCWSHGVFA